MPLIPELGAGLPDANSYASIAQADAYHLARHNVAWIAGSVADDLKAAALIRATSFIDATYRARFPGYPARLRGQALEWPRANAFLAGSRRGCDEYPAGYGQGIDLIPVHEVPREIIAATCEAALRELAEPGALAPDLERGGAIKSLRAGSVGIEYAGNAPATTVFQALDLALAGLLMPANLYSGRAVRG